MIYDNYIYIYTFLIINDGILESFQKDFKGHVGETSCLMLGFQ